MSLRMVTASTSIIVAWDGVVQNVARGTIVDIEPGSALEAAYGPDNLVDLGVGDGAEAVAAHAGVTN
jgi:hypothetical protein